MSERKKVCKCGKFKEQHGDAKANCQRYRFSHHEEVISYQEFKDQKKMPGFFLTKKDGRK